jgi:hypothetical protein
MGKDSIMTVNEDINIGAITEALNDKMDKDGMNAGNPACVVVESWHDNNGNWYRIYSDGWCEQGGMLSWSGNPTLTVSLLKEYTNTNYNVFTNCYGTYQEQYPNAIAINNKTVSEFELKPYTNNRAANWEAKGYIS